MSSEGGKKYDAGKPLLALLPIVALEEVGKVMTFGATKYAAYNWLGGLAYTRLLSAALRHIFAYLRGEDKDSESGLSHLAHAVCCLLMVLEFVVRGRKDLDDRYRPKTPEVL